MLVARDGPAEDCRRISIWTCVPVLQLFVGRIGRASACVYDGGMVLLPGIASVFRRFRVAGAVCGMIAAWVLPLSAQNGSPIRIAPIPAAAPRTLSQLAPEPGEFSETSRDSSGGKGGWRELVEFSGTPFTQQVRVPLGSLFGGRIGVGGFNAVTPMEHIQRGLPGGGSLDAWSPVPMGHAGVSVPKEDKQYGLCLTFHLAGGAKQERGVPWGKVASRLGEITFW
jgi:hypothetical protein